MKEQDKLKKLAEMAGITLEPLPKGEDLADWYKEWHAEFPVYDDGHCKERHWNPLEDMNQALEVWRKMGWRLVNGFPEFKIINTRHDEFACEIAGGKWYTGKTEAEALCNCLLEVD